MFLYARLSSLTAGTASTDVDGWMDVEEEQHSTSQGLALQLNKHSSDWWLPTFRVALSKLSAHPPNHRQWMAKQPLEFDAIFSSLDAFVFFMGMLVYGAPTVALL